MSTTLSSTILRATTLFALLLAPACGDKDDDATSGASEAATDGSGDPTGNSSNNSSGNSSNSSGNSGSDATSSPATTGDSGGETCYGDWTLGSVPFSGDPSLGQACDDPNVPKNCADGTYIKMGSGECICIAECSSLGKSVGETCIDGTNWVCQDVQATNASMNGGKLCVNSEWGLCQAGGSPPPSTSTSSGGDTSPTSSASASGSASDSDGEECLPSGSRCSFSSDCCSEDCTDDVCA